MSHQDQTGPTLSPADAAMLDRLIEVGFDVDRLGELSDEDQRRAACVMAIMGVLDGYEPADATGSVDLETLVDATLARIDRAESEREERMQLAAAAESGGGGFRLKLPEFIAVAAVLLIIASIMFPILSSLKNQRLDTRCLDNMRAMGTGMTRYAADNGGLIPTIATAGFGGLFGDASDMLDSKPLADGSYCDHGCMDCPSCSGQQPLGASFSYQIGPRGSHGPWNTPGVTVMLGDRNPILEALVAGEFYDPEAPSANHAGRVQNVLLSDGSTVALRMPSFGDDHIWVRQFSTINAQGTLVPDVFLGHEITTGASQR